MEKIGEGCRRKIFAYMTWHEVQLLLVVALENRCYGTIKNALEVVDLHLYYAHNVLLDQSMEDVLQWLINNGYCDRRDARLCGLAACLPDGNILKRLRFLGFAWDAKTCYLAAYKGHTENLIWLLENGCPWDGVTHARVIKNQLNVPLELFQSPKKCRGLLKF